MPCIGLDVKAIEMKWKVEYHTFVPDHPSRYAASFATSSPKPSIRPLTNGSTRLMAAPRSRPHSVGGWYRIRGEALEAGDDVEADRSALASAS